jgi:hypothetical protein
MPTSTKWTKRSPKGLREFRVRQATGDEAKRFFKLEPTGRPGEFVRCADWALMVRECLAKLRAEMLTAGGSNSGPDEKAPIADAPFLASSVISDINEIEALLSRLDRRNEADAVRRAAYEALQKMLVMMADFESWAMISNETALHTHVEKVDRFRKVNAKRRKEALAPQYQPEADAIWLRHRDWNKSDVAREIVKSHPGVIFNTLRRSIHKPKK